jgi:hypothetical protein
MNSVPESVSGYTGFVKLATALKPISVVVVFLIFNGRPMVLLLCLRLEVLFSYAVVAA